MRDDCGIQAVGLAEDGTWNRTPVLSVKARRNTYYMTRKRSMIVLDSADKR